jgi:hypothetical protein
MDSSLRVYIEYRLGWVTHTHKRVAFFSVPVGVGWEELLT